MSLRCNLNNCRGISGLLYNTYDIQWWCQQKQVNEYFPRNLMANQSRMILLTMMKVKDAIHPAYNINLQLRLQSPSDAKKKIFSIFPF